MSEDRQSQTARDTAPEPPEGDDALRRDERILRNIAAGEYTDLGDITTLADPSVVEKLIEGHKELKG